MTTIAEPADVSNGKTGKTLRELAQDAVAKAEAEARRERENRRESDENSAGASLLHHLKQWLGIEADAETVAGYWTGETDYSVGTFNPRVEIDGLTFGWEYRPGYGPRLFLCVQCPTCKAEIQTTGQIHSFTDLAHHIHQADEIAGGRGRCPACEYRREEEAEARAEVVAPPPKPPTQADRLHQLVREIAEEVVEERGDGQS